MSARPQENQGGDVLLVVGLGVVAVVAGGWWLIGNLAAFLTHGKFLHVGIDQSIASLGRLPQHTHDPKYAWTP